MVDKTLVLGVNKIPADKIEEKYGITLDTPDLWAFENGSVVAELDQDLIEASSNDYTEAIKRVLLLNKKEA